jgi:RimJ/RimL family protein N-acetyltransferase
MHKFPEKAITKRTIIRRIQLSDANDWKSFNNAIAKRMDWPKVPSVVYARNEILHYAKMWDAGKRYAYSILDRQTGQVIGDLHFKFIDKRKRVEFGYALSPKFWGTGIIYEVLRAAKSMADGLTLWCKVETSNIRSWKSLEKFRATFKGERMFVIEKQRKLMRVYEVK